MAKNSQAKIVTKKHLARQEKERQQTRWITGVAIAVIAIVFLSITYGILNDTVLLVRKPAVTVNGETATLREFQIRVKIARQRLIDQYMQYYQFAMMFGVDPTNDDSLSQTFSQIETQLTTPTYLGSQVLTDITNDFLIRQYARANGITVTEQEVEDAIRNTLGYYPDATPTLAPTGTPVVFSTLSATQFALLTPTVTSTTAPTRTLAPSRTPDLTATVTPIPSITPTATPYTLEGFQARYADTVDFYQGIGMNETDFRRLFFENGLYQQKVKDVITADVPYATDQVWARHILVGDEALANDIYRQLVDGEDFATLAALYSTDSNKDVGGDLGWFGTGKMVAEFESAAFSLGIGEISHPVQTTFGWHIIQVLGHEVRPLTAEEVATAVDTAFNDWLTEQKAAAEIVINEIWVDHVPTKPDLTDSFNNFFATETALVATYQVESDQQP
jgi:parvulin-like peptidyl-prolyl isomerase